MRKLTLTDISTEEKVFIPDDEDPEFKVRYTELTGEEFMTTRLKVVAMDQKSKAFFTFRNEILKAKISGFEGLEVTKEDKILTDTSEIIDGLASLPSQQSLLDQIFAHLYSSSGASPEVKNG